MKLLYRVCAALDVHKSSVCACIRKSVGRGEVAIEQETFKTFTSDLERLGEWLRKHKVKRVAMESTGVYWIPIWNVLEAKKYGLELLLVNPMQVKALPGQKTDPKDANRIAELHQYGLLRGSFIPPPAIRQLRDLVRGRTRLQQDKNRVVNRIARLLETANVKLGSVASNIVGVSGRRMLYAIAEGESDPTVLARLAVGSLQRKEADLALSLEGRFTPHFRQQLTDLLEDLRYIERRVERLERDIREHMAPHADLVRRLCTIPAVDETTTWTLISEVGLDMAQFPSANHLASWAGLCPGNNESAGKQRSGATRKGNRYLRRMLVQNGWAVSHSKDGFLTSVFLRVASRRGMRKAAIAVAHRILMITYYIIRDGVEYRELGGDHHDRLHPLRTARRLTERLDRLGFDVELRPKPLQSANEGGVSLDKAPRRGRPRGSTNRPRFQLSRPISGKRRLSENCEICKERGIPCIHPSLRRRKSADPACKMCSAWGITCIHVRNSDEHPTDTGDAPKPGNHVT